uniref:Uncharacterized protein n=1 Tax=Cacopsylla melanoneura TaxID=428564 RepID=A0A8D8PXX0_9HEMI
MIWNLNTSQNHAQVSSGLICASDPIAGINSFTDHSTAIIHQFRTVTDEKEIQQECHKLYNKLEISQGGKFGITGDEYVEGENVEDIVGHDQDKDSRAEQLDKLEEKKKKQKTKITKINT